MSFADFQEAFLWVAWPMIAWSLASVVPSTAIIAVYWAVNRGVHFRTPTQMQKDS